MPLSDGTLTQDEFNHVANKLLTFWANNGGKPPCRSCGGSNFFIHPALIANRSDTVSTTAPHTRLPSIVTYCADCGLADHYVARILGIEALQVEPGK